MKKQNDERRTMSEVISYFGHSLRFMIRLGENGMASIIITMVTMVVISLIVLGFATISRREQTQTLDRQLSTQAFYAAESGVEDARKVIQKNLATYSSVPSKTSCTNDTAVGLHIPYPTGAQTIIDAPNNVSYGCLLVDPSPPSLVFTGLDSNTTVVPINPVSNINKIVITWEPTAPPTGGTPVGDCPGALANSFSLQSKWKCGYALMRVDMVPTQGPVTRAGLQAGQATAFFEPAMSGGAPGNFAYSANVAKPNLIKANCNSGSYTQCTATINALGGTNNFTLRLNSLYTPSNVTITAFNGGAQVNLSGAQALIDTTGKASDVLRRIKVRLPLKSNDGPLPSFAIQSNGSLCKRFMATPGYYKNAGDVVAPIDPSNPMCDNALPPSGVPQSGG